VKNLTLRTKITLWYTAVLFLILAIFGGFLYVSMSRVLYSDAQELAKAHAAQAETQIEFENNRIGLGEFTRFTISGTYIQVYAGNGRSIGGTRMPSRISGMTPAFNRFRRVHARGSVWLVYDKPVYQDNKVVAWVRAARSLNSEEAALRNLGMTILLAVPVGVLVAALGGLFLSKKALSPIDHMTRTAAAIGQGDLTQRLDLPISDDEVGRLAVVFDEMLDKLEAFVKRERQFTSDASHELRTPLTVISAEAQEALAGDKSPEELRDALAGVLGAGARMELLISQLLKLTRSDERQSGLAVERVDLRIVAEAVVAELSAAAKAKDIEIEICLDEAGDGVEIEADQSLITSMFINLIDNAISYNKPGGLVRVSLAKEEQVGTVVIEDTGIGIPPEDIARIFDRFYRVDKARTGRGVGLGLSIVKWIVEAHQGSISVKSKLGKGTIFEIALPAQRPARET